MPRERVSEGAIIASDQAIMIGLFIRQKQQVNRQQRDWMMIGVRHVERSVGGKCNIPSPQSSPGGRGEERSGLFAAPSTP